MDGVRDSKLLALWKREDVSIPRELSNRAPAAMAVAADAADAFDGCEYLSSCNDLGMFMLAVFVPPMKLAVGAMLE